MQEGEEPLRDVRTSKLKGLRALFTLHSEVPSAALAHLSPKFEPEEAFRPLTEAECVSLVFYSQLIYLDFVPPCQENIVHICEALAALEALGLYFFSHA